MANIALNHIFSVWWNYLYNGQAVMFTTHWRVKTMSGAAPTIQDFSNAFESRLGDVGDVAQSLAACYNDNATNGEINIQDIYPTRYLKLRYIATYPEGTNTTYTTTFPANVAAVFTLRGDIAGPTHRGSKHIGCMADNFISGSILTSAGATALDQLAAVCTLNKEVEVGAVTVTMEPIIYHRAAPMDSSVVTSYILSSSSRVMRRRTVGLGI